MVENGGVSGNQDILTGEIQTKCFIFYADDDNLILLCFCESNNLRWIAYSCLIVFPELCDKLLNANLCLRNMSGMNLPSLYCGMIFSPKFGWPIAITFHPHGYLLH